MKAPPDRSGRAGHKGLYDDARVSMHYLLIQQTARFDGYIQEDAAFSDIQKVRYAYPFHLSAALLCRGGPCGPSQLFIGMRMNCASGSDFHVNLTAETAVFISILNFSSGIFDIIDERSLSDTMILNGSPSYSTES